MIYETPIARFIYRTSPPLVQHALISFYGLLQAGERLTPAYRRYRAELEQSQWWSPDDLRALQEERLRRLIAHAYENVPYYRRVFDERRLKPADIRTADDLYKLPILTKQDVRRHRADLRARNIGDRQVIFAQTGGTTGVAVRFLLDKQRIVFDRALTHRHWGWAGYRFGDRVAMLKAWGQLFRGEEPGTHWRYDLAGNRVYLANAHISRHTVARYVEKLVEWRPKYLAGLPSSMFYLARYLESLGLQIPLRACFPSSETLTPAAREVIERSFACRAWDRYGTSERLAVSQQCEHGSYHQNPEFGILQVDSPAGTPAAPGQTGEFFITGLTNFSMPLIRYAAGDMGALAEGQCPCRRGLPLMGRVDGRLGDVLVLRSGGLISLSDVGGFHTPVANAERCQLVQKRPGEVIVRVQAGPAFSQADADELIRLLRLRIGAELDIQVETVADLHASATGKFRFIVSEVDIDQAVGLRRDSIESRLNEAPPGVSRVV